MRAGRLDRTVTLERSTTTENPIGEPVESWQAYATVPAQVVQRSGKEFFEAAQLQSVRRVLFRLRWRAGVGLQDRVIYDGLTHNIEDVKELGRREGLELHTVADASAAVS